MATEALSQFSWASRTPASDGTRNPAGGYAEISYDQLRLYNGSACWSRTEQCPNSHTLLEEMVMGTKGVLNSVEDFMGVWPTTKHENEARRAASKGRVSLRYKQTWSAIA